mmetsp:Transcript_33058/g.82211  ORF Transcript_33058/g.82211 Transcript_33058/m.82211 type:complete len:663 (-) Transcript_33058:93-2081(-)
MGATHSGACSAPSDEGLSDEPLRSRFALRRLFARYAEHGELSAAGLAQLASREQSTPLDLAAASAIVAKFSRRGGSKGAPGALTYTEFRTMLLEGGELHFQAEWLPVLAEPHDLKRPLSQFFVATSYATSPLDALAPAQPEAIILAYVAALTDGARCVEVYAYEGSEGAPEPLVRRVMGGAPELSLRTLLHALVEALPDGHLPLILSIENHMTSEACKRGFVAACRSELGTKLCMPELDMRGRPVNAQLPLVSELRGKVLLRCRTGGNFEIEKIVLLRAASFRGSTLGAVSVLESADLPAAAVSRLLVPVAWATPGDDSTPLSEIQISLGGADLPQTAPSVDVGSGGTKQPPGPSKMANPTDGTGGANSGMTRASKGLAAVKRHAVAFESATDALGFTAARFVRTHSDANISPAAALDPLRAWELGVQCAAVLSDAPGLAADLNRAMFSRNGGQGYVAKPEWMVPPSSRNPNSAKPKYAASSFFLKKATSIKDVLALNARPARPHWAKLTLTIYSAYPDSKAMAAPDFKKSRDLLVRVGVLTGYGGFEQQTTRAAQPGPLGARHWGETLTITTEIAELAFLRLELRGQKQLAASFTAWLPAIGPGVRCVEMTTADGRVAYRLLVRVRLQLRAEGDETGRGEAGDDGREDGFGRTEMEVPRPY